MRTGSSSTSRLADMTIILVGLVLTGVLFVRQGPSFLEIGNLLIGSCLTL